MPSSYTPTAEDIAAMRRDRSEFRRRINVETDGCVHPFEPDPWQAADFAATDDGWQLASGFPCKPKYRRAYLERGRGHSKTTDTAINLMDSLVLATNPLRAFWIAADKEQGGLGVDSMQRLGDCNPWLRKELEFNKFEITNPRTGSKLEILSADVGSSFGILPDIICIDELTRWPRRELLDSLVSSAGKRKTSYAQVISNAGYGRGSSWHWLARESWRENPGVYFSRLDGPQASWMGPEQYDEQRLLLPPSAFKCDWLNEWVADFGDLSLPAEEVDAAFAADNPIISGFEPGVRTFFSVDLGIRKDRTGFSILTADCNSGLVHGIEFESWSPPVDIDAVERRIIELGQVYRPELVVFDWWQAESMEKHLQAFGFNTCTTTNGPHDANVMAVALVNAFRDRRIVLPDNPELRAGVSRLQIQDRPNGLRIVAPTDREIGHCDLAMSMTLGLPFALQAADELPQERMPTFAEIQRLIPPEYR